MASYNASINLLAFKQAQLLSGLDPKNPQRGYVCIPVDINEIKVTGSTGTTPLRAAAKVNMWPLRNPEALLAATNRNRQQRGDAPITLEQQHTHTLDVSFSIDFIKAAIRAYGQRLIDRVLATQTPEYVAKIKDLDPMDENLGLFKAIRSYMQPKLANMYLNRTQQPSTQQPVAAFAQATAAQQWTPPTVDPNGTPQDPFDQAAYADPDSDMPF